MKKLFTGLFVGWMILMLGGCATHINEPTKADQLILNVDPILLEPVDDLITLEQYKNQ